MCREREREMGHSKHSLSPLRFLFQPVGCHSVQTEHSVVDSLYPQPPLSGTTGAVAVQRPTLWHHWGSGCSEAHDMES